MLAQQTTHTNSSLTADNLNVVTTGDATIIGGNLHGATGVSMDIGGDLTLESVQDRFSGSSQGAGISGGMSLGGVFTNENGAGANSREAKTTAVGQGDGISSVSGGLNASSGRYQTTETVVSSITGGAVDITVDGHTQLTGALIAALDIEGNDTGQVNLSTGSLNFTDLSNRSYSSHQSIGVNANVGVSDAANPADPTQSTTDLALNSSHYSYQNDSSQSLSNALATIGEGSITVGGEATDPSGLNRDVDNLTNDMYAVDRQQGNIDLTVDHRLLSEDGRKQIAEDVKRTQILGGSVIDIIESSVSLIGAGDGESSLREHIGHQQDYFTATKLFTQSVDNDEHVATLENPHATPEQKQAAYTALANQIATYIGVDPTEALVLMENDPQFAGVFSRDSDTIYVNDAGHANASEAVNTVGHETQHYLDNQDNPDAERTDQYVANRENYAHIMGDATENYLNFNFAQSGNALADSNSHSLGNTAQEALSNLNTLANNQQQFAGEESSAFDQRYLHPEERALAEQLAQASDGRFTTQEILDTLRHARASEQPDYPQGMNEHVLDITQATDETFQYLDGSEGRLTVTPDGDGNARYIIQDMANIPLNEDAKAYIEQQDLGYSFAEPTTGNVDSGWSRDFLTGRPLDEQGQYWVGYNVDGTVYNVPHYSCATADCLSQNLNIDWDSGEGQAYQNALTAKGLDDVSTTVTAASLFSPAIPLTSFLLTTGTITGLGSSYYEGELARGVGENTSSVVFEFALKDMLGKTKGQKVNTVLDLIGVHEQNVIFIPSDEEIDSNLKRVPDESD